MISKMTGKINTIIRNYFSCAPEGYCHVADDPDFTF